MKGPDFYLASAEGYDLEAPRSCWPIKRVSTEGRDDLLLVRSEPAVMGQKYGLGERDVDLVLIAPRHQGASLFPINEWPLCVHVARLLIENADRDILREDEFVWIAWAELYRTEEDAQMKVM